MTPPPAKRPRVIASADQGEPSSSSSSSPPQRSWVATSEQGSREGALPSVGEFSGGSAAEESSGSPSSSAMQSNGVIHENGTSSNTSAFTAAVNGLGQASLKSNGCEAIPCEGEEVGSSTGGGESEHIGATVPLVRKRKPRQLSSKDTDIIRLIGQHLREMGFK